MHPTDNVSAKIIPPATDRCRLVFYGDTSQNLPRDVVLERLRLLLKDSPEKFQRRMARMPLVLLPDADRATARQYQQILARRGIACRIVTADTTLPGMPVSPNATAGDTDHRPPLPNPVASSFSPPVDPASGRFGELPRMARLGVNLCFNPRGIIGSVLSTAPYRLTLILAAGVGLTQAAGAVFDAPDEGAYSALLKFLAVLVLAPPIGILLLYVRGFILHRAGRFLHGKAHHREVRTALAWSEIPLLLGSGVLLLQIVMGGLGPAAAGGAGDHSLPVLLSQAGFGLLHAMFGLWAFSLLLHTIAEIQGFSMGRSLASIVLAAAMVIIPMVIVGGLLIGPDILHLT
jgi:hypothetical protein